MSPVAPTLAARIGIWAVLTGSVLVLVGAEPGIVIRAPNASAAETGTGTGDASLTDTAGSFTIEGSATQTISPGVRAALDLTLTNPHPSPMSVVDLSVTVQEISAPNADSAHPCTIGDFRVTTVPSTARITLPADSAKSLSHLGLPPASWPHIGMLNRPVDQDGCKGASLTLGFTASGEVHE